MPSKASGYGSSVQHSAYCILFYFYSTASIDDVSESMRSSSSSIDDAKETRAETSTTTPTTSIKVMMKLKWNFLGSLS